MATATPPPGTGGRPAVAPRGWAVELLPWLLGALAFCIVLPPGIVDPGDTAWIGQHGDPLTAHLGSVFFRASDWQWPVGLNPAYGIEISTSVVYSDSNPLLAVLFKLLSPVFPSACQYFGLALLAFFLLQGVFAWKLVSLATRDTLVRLCGTVLFLFYPGMLFRLSGHYNLAGHFVILAGLYLCLRPGEGRRVPYWIGLLVVAAGTHAYLLAMAGGLWAADALGRAFVRRPSLRRLGGLRRLAGEVVLVMAAVVFSAWQFGYFVGNPGDVTGFGHYRGNLLGMIDPAPELAENRWSRLLSYDVHGDNYEGFVYAGSGVLALAGLALLGLVRRPAGSGGTILPRHARVLPLALLLFLLFFLSNVVSVATASVTIPLPERAMALANVFRASGRFFWPIHYFLLFAAVVLFVRTPLLFRHRWLLVPIALLQIVDTSGGWLPERQVVARRIQQAPAEALASDFWREAATRYDTLRLLPPANHDEAWAPFAAYAAASGMQTDSVYVARHNNAGLDLLRAKDAAVLSSGRYEPGTLYVVRQPSLVPVITAALDEARDAVFQVDGHLVVAPGWNACANCGRHPVATAPVPADTIRFGAGQSGAEFLWSGWFAAEPWGAWSIGDRATLVLPVPASTSTVVLEIQAFVPEIWPRQRVNVSMNGVEAARLVFDRGGPQIIRIDLPPAAVAQARADPSGLLIGFDLPDARSPSELGMNPDTRKLAVGIRSITFR